MARIFFIAGFLFLGGVPRLSAAPAVSTASVVSPNQARYGELKGDVQVLQAGASTWMTIRPNVPMEPGDQIATGDDSEAELLINENVLWLLQPNSQLVIQRSDTDAGFFSLPEGTLLGRVDPARNGQPQRWGFITPTADISIRGTEFAICVSTGLGTQLGVYSGQVQVRTADLGESEPDYVVGANEEGIARRGESFRKALTLSEPLRLLGEQRRHLRNRMQQVRNVWTSNTIVERLNLRRRVLPAVKVNARPKVIKRRRPQKENR